MFIDARCKSVILVRLIRPFIIYTTTWPVDRSFNLTCEIPTFARYLQGRAIVNYSV